MRRRRATRVGRVPGQVAAMLAVVALTAAGCGSEVAPSAEAPESAPSRPTSGVPTATDAPDAPTAAYLAWLAALEAQDAEAACARHAPQLTIDLRFQAILVDRAELGDPCTDFVALLWEDPDRRYEPVEVETTRATEEKATLAASFEDGAETVQLVYHRATWRVLSTSRRTDAGPAGTGGAGPDRWLDAWCELDTEMDRATVTGLMGPPSGEYTISNGGEPQLWWAADQYDFRAYLEADGTVLELVGDYDALSAADRERLDCPELR